jgi:hypothetical protein
MSGYLATMNPDLITALILAAILIVSLIWLLIQNRRELSYFSEVARFILGWLLLGGIALTFVLITVHFVVRYW